MCDDYPTTVQMFHRLLGDRTTTRRPKGLEGHNFMTPDVLGYVLDSDSNPVEISTGTGFTHERLYGLTHSRTPDGRCDERDQCVYSWDSVLAVLGV